jgi:ribosomal protein L37E
MSLNSHLKAAKGVFKKMTIARWKYMMVLVISLLLLFTFGCIDMEVDLTINKDSTGKAKLIVTSTEPFYNGFVDEFVEDVRRANPEARINESLKGLNKSAQIEFPFNNVNELARHGFNVTHFQDDKLSYIQIQEIQEVPVEITLRMPGKIVASNGKYSGSKVTWEKGYMNEPYWVESEVGGILGITSDYYIPGLIVIIVGFGGWYFFKRKNDFNSLESETGQNSLNCGNCGLSFDPEDRYCANCGFPKGFISPTNNFRQVKHWTGMTKDRPSSPYLSIAIVALVVIAIIAIFVNEYSRESAAVSGGNEHSGNYPFYSDESFTDYSDGSLIDEENKNSDDGISSETVSETEEIDPEEEDEDVPDDNDEIYMPWSGGTYNGGLLDGIPHGYGIWHGSDGRKYYGDFVHGEMTGYGTMVFPGGETYVGDFNNGVGHGHGVMTHPDGRSVRGTWVNGVYQDD